MEQDEQTKIKRYFDCSKLLLYTALFMLVVSAAGLAAMQYANWKFFSSIDSSLEASLPDGWEDLVVYDKDQTSIFLTLENALGEREREHIDIHGIEFEMDIDTQSLLILVPYGFEVEAFDFNTGCWRNLSIWAVVSRNGSLQFTNDHCYRL